LAKGSIVFVEGRLQTRNWEGKDGQSRRTTEIICERLQLGPRGSAGGPPKEVPAGQIPQADVPSAEDIPVVDIEADRKEKKEDLPF